MSVRNWALVSYGRPALCRLLFSIGYFIINSVLCGSHDNGEGDVAVIRQIICPENYSLRNWRTVRAKWTGALTCWDRPYSMIGSVGHLWHNASRYEQRWHFLQGNIDQWQVWQLYLSISSRVMGGLLSQSRNEGPVGPTSPIKNKQQKTTVANGSNRKPHGSWRHLTSAFV